MQLTKLIKENNTPLLAHLPPEQVAEFERHLINVMGILELDCITFSDADLEILEDELGLNQDLEEKIEAAKEKFRRKSRNYYASYILESAINIFKIIAISQGQTHTPPLIQLPVYGNNNPLEALRIQTRYFIEKKSYPFIPNHPNIPFSELIQYAHKLIELLKNWSSFRTTSRETALTQIQYNNTPQNKTKLLIETEHRINEVRRQIIRILDRHYLSSPPTFERLEAAE